jgi:hypothetical protein
MSMNFVIRITTCVLIGAAVAPAPARAQAIPPNVRLNSDSSPYLQNEEQVWINLTDSLNVIADWRDWRLGYRRIGMGRSTDGGASWFDVLVEPNIFDRQSDPVLVGDRSGRFFMNMLDYDNSTPQGDGNSHIVVYTSTNGGIFWNGPVPLQPLGPYFEDKQFTAVDRTGGPYDGNYYCSWTRFNNPTRILFVRSTDGGASFDDTVAVGPLLTTSCGTWDQGQFSIPIVGSDGSVHVFWQGIDLDSNTCLAYRAIRHSYSTDGGVTFTPDVAAFLPNLSYGSVDGGIDVYGMPNGDADISGGPHDGSIYISQTQHYSGYSGETDVIVRTSHDNGATWSTPERVNDDAEGNDVDQFHPWLYVNEDGTIVMVFYDQRKDPGHYLFDCYGSASFDGAETFVHNFRLSSQSSNPSLLAAARALPRAHPDDPPTALIDPAVEANPTAGLIAEYIGVHARHDYAVAVWTDTRDGTQDVYSARYVIPFMPPRLYLPLEGTVTPDSLMSYRWSTCWHETEDSYRLEIAADSLFATIEQSYPGLTDNDYAAAGPLPAGHHFWRVKAFRAAGDSTDYSEIFNFPTGCQAAATPGLQQPADGSTLDATAVDCEWDIVADANSYRLQVSTFPDFSVPLLDTSLVLPFFALTGLSDSTIYFWRVNATNDCGTGPWAMRVFSVGLCPVTLTGDVNISGAITSADIIYLVSYAFKSGPAPLPVPEAGDVNCDGQVNSADIIYLVNFVFKSGPSPCDACSLL